MRMGNKHEGLFRAREGRRLVMDMLGLRDWWDTQGNIPEDSCGCWAGIQEEARNGAAVVLKCRHRGPQGR